MSTAELLSSCSMIWARKTSPRTPSRGCSSCLDARINNKRPTIVTTQFQNNELLKRYRGKVDDREMIAAVLSRLALFRTIEFQGVDRRLK